MIIRIFSEAEMWPAFGFVCVLTIHHSPQPQQLLNGAERWKVPASDAAFGSSDIEAGLGIGVICRSLEVQPVGLGCLLMLMAGKSSYKPLNVISDEEQGARFL